MSSSLEIAGKLCIQSSDSELPDMAEPNGITLTEERPRKPGVAASSRSLLTSALVPEETPPTDRAKFTGTLSTSPELLPDSPLPALVQAVRARTVNPIPMILLNNIR